MDKRPATLNIFDRPHKLPTVQVHQPKKKHELLSMF